MRVMNTLDKIVARKKEELQERQSLFPTKLLEQSIYFGSDTVSLRDYLLREDKSGIIAEIKRKSPSKGFINNTISVERTSIGYMQAGASALSILTDNFFFGGSLEDLQIARKFNYCPILRKEFILNEYQVLESKSIGADAILLIAAMHDTQQLLSLTRFAHSLGLEVLLEIHNAQEINTDILHEVDVVGVNSRNLKTLEVSLEVAKGVSALLPDTVTRIAESGISNPSEVVDLRLNYGYDGFLIGSHFMTHSRPEMACSAFIASVLEEEDRIKNK